MEDTRKMGDIVERPSHYNRNGIEIKDVIDAFELNFHTGSAVKYICRARYKDSYEKDLKKAIQSLQNELLALKG